MVGALGQRIRNWSAPVTGASPRLTRLLIGGAFGALAAIPVTSWAQTIVSQIPQAPPVPVPHGPTVFYGAFNMALTLLVIVLLVREAIRSRSLLPFAFLAGGALAGIVEPVFDGNVHVVFSQPAKSASWIFYNVAYPWYVIPGNAVLGGPVYWMYLKFKNGISTRGLWTFFFVWWAADAFQEIPGTTLGFFRYFGPQPFLISGWPLWIGTLAALGLPLAGYAAYLLRNAFEGARLYLLVAILMPVVIYGSEVIAWPMWITLNGGMDVTVTRWMAVLSFAFVVSAYYAMTKVYAKSRATPAAA